jgi:hypothetical protein
MVAPLKIILGGPKDPRGDQMEGRLEESVADPGDFSRFPQEPPVCAQS